MVKLTNTCGCVIERDFLYISQILDSNEPYDEFSRLSFYDSLSATPWLAHDLGWRIMSVCVWQDSPFGGRVYVALSNQGDVELVGPSSKPHVKEHIPGSGLSHPSSRKKGFMNNIRQVGKRLYACGGGFSVFVRDEHFWKDISSTEDHSASMSDGQTYFDLKGNNEQSIYAVGIDGVNSNRISFFDGDDWSVVDSKIGGLLTSLEVSQSGTVYVGGSDGRLFFGDVNKGFTISGLLSSRSVVISIVEFEGYLYIASSSGLFRTRGAGRPIEDVDTNLRPKPIDVRNLSVGDGVLWVFCGKDLICFDGERWTRLIDPDL